LTLRFSTDALPERDRVAIFRELFGRKVMRLEIEPLGDDLFRSDLSARMLPGLGIVSGTNSSFRVGRTRNLVTDGDNNLILQISTRPGVASQFGREVALGAGDAVVMSNADIGTFTFPSASKITALSLPRAALAALLANGNGVLLRPILRDTEALRLLVRYLGALLEDGAPQAPELQRLAVTHVYDLVAMALGASRDAAEIAKGRGLRAARLRAIKMDIAEKLARSELTVNAIAAQHRITSRYVQMLFEMEGTTFSEFLLGQRLHHAHRMLTNPRFADRTISAIVFEAGFNDLSYFNRTFRRRYGATPSDVRARARLEGERPAG
jgi:AraC-like DNA-binding protein